MSEGVNGIVTLPEDWQDQARRIAAGGLDPMRVLAAKVGVDRGAFTDACEYVPDRETWAYYRELEPQQ